MLTKNVLSFALNTATFSTSIHPLYISLDFEAGVHNSERCDDRRAIDGRYFLTHWQKGARLFVLPSQSPVFLSSTTANMHKPHPAQGENT